MDKQAKQALIFVAAVFGIVLPIIFAITFYLVYLDRQHVRGIVSCINHNIGCSR